MFSFRVVFRVQCMIYGSKYQKVLLSAFGILQKSKADEGNDSHSRPENERDAGINIGSMNLGRRSKAGEAMVVLSLDTPADEETIQKICDGIGAHFAKAVHMSF